MYQWCPAELPSPLRTHVISLKKKTLHTNCSTFTTNSDTKFLMGRLGAEFCILTHMPHSDDSGSHLPCSLETPNSFTLHSVALPSVWFSPSSFHWTLARKAPIVKSHPCTTTRSVRRAQTLVTHAHLIEACPFLVWQELLSLFPLILVTFIPSSHKEKRDGGAWEEPWAFG